jgi:hypothetical protein
MSETGNPAPPKIGQFFREWSGMHWLGLGAVAVVLAIALYADGASKAPARKTRETGTEEAEEASSRPSGMTEAQKEKMRQGRERKKAEREAARARAEARAARKAAKEAEASGGDDGSSGE